MKDQGVGELIQIGKDPDGLTGGHVGAAHQDTPFLGVEHELFGPLQACHLHGGQGNDLFFGIGIPVDGTFDRLDLHGVTRSSSLDIWAR